MVVVSRGGGGGGESGETERAGGRLRRHDDVTVWTCWASAAGYARHSTDAGARCAPDRLGLAGFNSRLLGVFPPPVDEQVL